MTAIDGKPQAKLAKWLDGQLPSSGKLFTASYINTSVIDDGTLDIRIRTATIEIDLWVTGNATGESEYTLYEGINATSGTQITARNLKRASSTTPTATVFHTPNVTAGDISGATALSTEYAIAGMHEIGKENGPAGWILQANTTYMLRHTNRDGAPKVLSDRIRWQEE
jgi:hypothetical protein